MDFATQVANNDAIRYAICQNAMPMAQPLPPVSVSGTISSSNNIVVIQPRLVGLLTGLLIEVNTTVRNAGASTANRTDLGAANIIDRIQFTDLSNYLRHNTKGYHFALLNSAKSASWYGGAIAPNLPMNVGNVGTVQSLASTLGTGATTAGRFFYYVPIAYNPQNDLRGAIFGQVTNATYNLTLTLNANAGYTTGDPLNAIMGGTNTTVTQENVTIKVTQLYYDQLPRDPSDGQIMLPWQDLSVNYMLNDTTWSGLTVNTENTFAYANARTFLSTFAIFDNGATFSATGSDVSYWALKYANSLLQWQYNPETVQLNTRNQIGFDFPPACYYFDHRNFPIATAQYGNCDLVLNPSTVNANAFNVVLYEQFAANNAIRNAQSLPQGN